MIATKPNTPLMNLSKRHGHLMLPCLAFSPDMDVQFHPSRYHDRAIRGGAALGENEFGRNCFDFRIEPTLVSDFCAKACLSIAVSDPGGSKARSIQGAKYELYGDYRAELALLSGFNVLRCPAVAGGRIYYAIKKLLQAALLTAQIKTEIQDGKNFAKIETMLSLLKSISGRLDATGLIHSYRLMVKATAGSRRGEMTVWAAPADIQRFQNEAWSIADLGFLDPETGETEADYADERTELGEPDEV